MKIEQLDMFSRVVDTGSISATARAIHRVPSNISTRIKQLEDELGVNLFIRERHILRPTTAALKLKYYSDRILTLVDEARAVVGQEEMLSIASIHSTAVTRLPSIITQYHHDYPDVQLNLSTGYSVNILEGIQQGCFRAGFVCGPMDKSKFDYCPAFQEEMVIVSPTSIPDLSSSEQLSGMDAYAFNKNCHYHTYFKDWMNANDIQCTNIYEIGCFHSIMAFIQSCGGIAMLPRNLIENIPNHSDVNVHRLDERWRYVDTHFVWQGGKRDRSIERMINILNQSVEVSLEKTA